MLTTTIKEIKAIHLSEDDFKRYFPEVGGKGSDDDPVTIEEIMNAAGLRAAALSLRTQKVHIQLQSAVIAMTAVDNLIYDYRSREAVVAAKLYLDGGITGEDLNAATRAAHDAQFAISTATAGSYARADAAARCAAWGAYNAVAAANSDADARACAIARADAAAEVADVATALAVYDATARSYAYAYATHDTYDVAARAARADARAAADAYVYKIAVDDAIAGVAIDRAACAASAARACTAGHVLSAIWAAGYAARNADAAAASTANTDSLIENFRGFLGADHDLAPVQRRQC